MSANLDLVRSIYADWERGDFSSADWADPESEWVTVEGPSPGRAGVGLPGLAKAMGDWLSDWSDFQITADEYRELDDERVLALASFSGRGRTSGITLKEINAEVAAVFHLRSSRVTRYPFYWDRYRALADLGLEG